MITALAQSVLPTFLLPGMAVAGAVATGIPIIIHILSRRPRKPEPWAAMKFLLAAYKKHRIRTRMEQLLLLATRCLILLLLGAALAGPVWSALGSIAGFTPRGRTLVLILDNSLTSAAKSDSASPARLESLKKTAAKLIDGLGPRDRIALITAARPAAALISPPTVDPAGAHRMIQSLISSEAAADIPGALRLGLEAINHLKESAGDVYVSLLSDFSAGAMGGDGSAAAALPQELARIGDKATLLMSNPAASLPNVQIAWLEPDRRLVTPGGAGESPAVAWTIKLRRYTPAPRGGELSTVRLEIPRMAGPALRQPVAWTEGQTETELRLTTVFNKSAEDSGSALLAATASLEPPAEGSDGLNIDNQRRSVVRLRPRLGVVLLDRTLESAAGAFTAKKWLTIALAPVADRLGWPIDVKLLDAATLDPQAIASADALFVLRGDLLDEAGWAAIKSHVNSGRLAIFTAPAHETPSIWPQKMADAFGLPWSITLEAARHTPPLRLAADQAAVAELFRLRSDLSDLSKPIEFYRRLPIDPASLGGRTDLLLKGEGGQPLLVAGDSGQGRVVFMPAALDLEWTNLTIKPLFVPLIHETLRAAVDRLQPRREYEPGDLPLLTGSFAGVTKIVGPAGKDVLLTAVRDTPDHTIPAVQPIRPLDASGVYTSDTDALTVNIRSAAGNTLAADPGALRAWLGGAGRWQPLKDEDPTAAMRSDLLVSDWGWHVLWAVLALAVIETFLARYVSHAHFRNRTEDALAIQGAA